MDPDSQALFGRKVVSVEALLERIGPHPRGKTVVMCHGTFDLVHPGHIRHLSYAKSKGDILVASLTADQHITKSPHRPFAPEELRALNLAALEMVDFVIVDREAKPLLNLERIKPEIFVKGFEYGVRDVHPRTKEEMAIVEAYGGTVMFSPDDVVYSSSRIIEQHPPNLSVEKLKLEMDKERISFNDLYAALDRLPGLKVHVVGDTIVDTITYCDPIGGSNKTPTLSVKYDRRTDFVGGAGVVAKHMRSAGAAVTFTTVLGDDALRSFVEEDLADAGVALKAIVDPGRPTTNKNALVADGHRLLKVDTLSNDPIADEHLATLLTSVEGDTADLVALCDFRHGIFNKASIPAIVAKIPGNTTRVANSQVASRWGNILEFVGFDLVTCNEKEARFVLHDQDGHVRELAEELYARAQAKSLIMTMGRNGVLCRFHSDKTGDCRNSILEPISQQVVDPVGAGDALLSYAALVLTATGNQTMALILGNIAAGCACETEGNEPVTPGQVRARLEVLEGAFAWS